MTQYLVAIQHPDDHDPTRAADEAMDRDIDALNDAMEAAGVRIFVGGLKPPGSARSLRLGPGGTVRVTDGPYTEAREHIGGFWVLEAADLDEALEWGRKAAIRLPGTRRGTPVLLRGAAGRVGRHRPSAARR